jgi:hypothetical protein
MTWFCRKGPLPWDLCRDITCDNAAKLYGIKLD